MVLTCPPPGHETAQNPPPACLVSSSTGEFELATSSLLTSLEQVLLPCALPRVSLSHLGLDEYQLARWPALRDLDFVIKWYLSFGFAKVGDDTAIGTKARVVLDRIRVLDLSWNRLAGEYDLSFPFLCFVTDDVYATVLYLNTP